MRLIRSAAPAAVCVSADGTRRGATARVLCGRRTPPALPARARGALDESPPGRVVTGGTFESTEARAAIASELGPDLAPSLRPTFEWYLCRGAFFHNDAHYGGVLFGVWCTDGPPRELVFPRLGLRVPAAIGDWAVFDPFEPHAVLDPGTSAYLRDHYLQAAPSVFAGFEIALDDAVRSVFAIGAPAPAALELSSRSRVNAQTGAVE